LTYEQAVARGSAAKDPARFADRKNSPITTGQLGDPPDYFDAALSAIWLELSEAIPAGITGSADRVAVEMATKLLHQFRTEPAMQASRLAILTNLLSRLGLDPQGRTRLQVTQGSDDESSNTSAFDQFMSAISGADTTDDQKQLLRKST
jgi:phage terminase small subunit